MSKVTPRDREEKLLAAIAEGTTGNLPTPRNRKEKLLKEIYDNGSSGGGGTTNYNNLTNKPSINNVPLVGNLNTANLKLTDATLTEKGVPAEAKEVGVRLEEQSTSLTVLSEQLGNHTVKTDVPENAVFTDTVYDDTEVKESIDELNSNLSEQVKDLYDNVVFTPRYYLNSNGNTVEANGWNVSDYVELSPIMTSVVFENVIGGSPSVCFFNENKVFIRGEKYNDRINWSQSIPNGAKYCRYCLHNTNVSNSNVYSVSFRYNNEHINESLEDYGLDNKFANGLAYGYCSYSGRNFSFKDLTENDSYIGSKTEYSCVGGEPLKILFSQTMEQITIQFNNNSFFTANNVDKIETVIPSGVTKLSFYVKKNNIKISNIGYIGIYINNQIDSLKNDLGGLSFSVSGTTLSITDGTNTWTLEANS